MLLRLVFAPIIIAAFMVLGILYVASAGIGWIFTGEAQVNITWPEWHERARGSDSG